MKEERKKWEQRYNDEYEQLDDTVVLLVVASIVCVGIFTLIYIGVF